MDYNKHDELKAELAEVLRKHFRGTNDAEDNARELLSDLSIAIAMQKMENQDKPPEKDIQNLDEAAKAIGKAASALKLVGQHGSADMVEILHRIFPERWDDGFGRPGSMRYARDHLIEHIEIVQAELEVARDSVDPLGASFNTVFGEGEEFEKFSGLGKQKNSAAYHFASELAQVYYLKTGEKPTVNTNPHVKGNPAYGPFLDLVTDSFKAVGISAKPERCARLACKDFSPPK